MSVEMRPKRFGTFEKRAPVLKSDKSSGVYSQALKEDKLKFQWLCTHWRSWRRPFGPGKNNFSKHEKTNTQTHTDNGQIAKYNKLQDQLNYLV